jgi:hypothetical protein
MSITSSIEAPPDPTPARLHLGPPASITIVVLLCATLIKVAWALTSAGSVDAVLFYNFARAIEKMDLCTLYSLDQKFNHTPLTGGFVLLLYRAASGDYLIFAFLLRLAGILADVAVVSGLLCWREKLGDRPPWWALVLFAASPVSLMVSGFHGNVDPLMTAALFFAALAAVAGRPVLCGLLFGLACNVKIVPLVLAPVFFFFWIARGRPWHFAGIVAAVVLVGAAQPLLVCPREYLHNVFGYGSTWGVWGVPYFLRLTGWAAVQKIDFHDLTAAQVLIASALKFTAVGGILAFGWRRRRVAPVELPATLGLAWIVFFLCAPGIGVQYMVWCAPFLLLLDARGYAVVTAAATLFLVVFYAACSPGRFPWFLAVPRGPETPLWSAVGTLTWLAFAGAFWWARGALGKDGVSPAKHEAA